MEPQVVHKVDVVVVGAGVFGAAAAKELGRRAMLGKEPGEPPRWQIALVDGGPVLKDFVPGAPRALDSADRSGVVVGGGRDMASSADISKILRSDYGKDVDMQRLHNTAWRRWVDLDSQWREPELCKRRSHSHPSLFLKDSNDPASPFVHQTGVSVLSFEAAPPRGSFVGDTLSSLQSEAELHGTVAPEPFNGSDHIHERLSALNAGEKRFEGGYFNPQGGWAESGRCTEQLVLDALDTGAVIAISHAVDSLVVEHESSRSVVRGVRLDNGRIVSARVVVVACGPWTTTLVPETRPLLRPVAMPVFHFDLGDDATRAKFTYPNLVPFTADISSTGFYGFPFHANAGVLKVGHHGAGHPVDPVKGATSAGLLELASQVRADEEKKFRTFLRQVFPEIAEKPVALFRLCQYCDSHNSDFLIGRVPGFEQPEDLSFGSSLVVASGGSGHGFKFGPVVGEIIADALLGTTSDDIIVAKAEKRFAWREAEGDWVVEQARHVAAPSSSL